MELRNTKNFQEVSPSVIEPTGTAGEVVTVKFPMTDETPTSDAPVQREISDPITFTLYSSKISI